MKKHILCILVIISCGLLAACEKTTVSPKGKQDISPSTSPSVTAIPTPTGYILPEEGRKTELSTGAPEPNSIIVFERLADLTNTDAYLFNMSELPAYDESKEKDYFFDGKRITFAMIDARIPLFGTRAVTSEADFGYTMKNIADIEFVPVPTDDKNACLNVVMPMVICVEGSDGNAEVYGFTDKGYVIRGKGKKGATGIAPEAISSSPVDEIVRLHVEAMAFHYVYCEMYAESPFAGFNTENINFTVTLTCDNRKVDITDSKDIIDLVNFTRRESGGYYFDEEFPSILMADEINADLSKAIRVSVGTATGLKEFEIMPDGRIRRELPVLSLGTTGAAPCGSALGHFVYYSNKTINYSAILARFNLN